MAVARLFNQGIWTWFNYPVATYDSASASSYIGWMARAATSTSDIWIGQYRHDYQHWDVYRLATAFQNDDHNNPAVLPLASGKILVAYSQHNGTSFSRLSTSAGSIKAFDAAVTVNNAATYNDAYANLAQTSEGTIWWFHRKQLVAGSSWQGNWYRTSTDGSTWGAAVRLFANGTERPYMRACQSGDRIDFTQTDRHPDGSANSIYHFYMVVDSGGSWYTLYKSDGTTIGEYNLDGSAHSGSPPALPLEPGDVTQVYDGSTNKAWCWDIGWVGGSSLQLLYAVITTTTNADDTHSYRRATLSSGTWSLETICNGGGTQPNWIYPDSSSAEPQYSGGLCLDLSTADRVYVARKHAATSTVTQLNGNLTRGSAVVTGISSTTGLSAGMAAGRFELPGGTEIATVDSGTQVTLTNPSDRTVSAAPILYQSADVRIEQWDKSGSWSLTSTIHNPGQTSARPFVVRGAPTTMVLWWSGVYGSYTDFYSGIYQSDAYAVYNSKASTPSWTSSVAPPGTQAYWLVHEGSGTTLSDLTGNYNGTFVGSPSWGSDSIGPNLSSFSTSNYITADALASALATQLSANTPVWYAALIKNSGTSAGTYAFGGASSASNNPIFGLSFNNGATNTIKFFCRNDANSDQSVTVASETRINDGNWHLYCWLRNGTGSNATIAYLDGQQIGTATVSGNHTPTTFTIGCLRRAAVVANTGFGGTIGALIVGWGTLPDFTSLNLDLAAYQFGGTRASTGPSEYTASSTDSVGISGVPSSSKDASASLSDSTGISGSASSVRDAIAALSDSVSLSCIPVSSIDGTASAFDTIGISGVPSHVSDKTASAQDTASFSASPSSSITGSGENQASDAVSLSEIVAVLFDKNIGSQANLAINASPSATTDSDTTPNLGRFRRGDTVVVTATFVSSPDSWPVLTIADPDGDFVTSYRMATDDALTFYSRVAIGPWELGTFSVSIAYSVSGEQQTANKKFDVVAGGDSGGDVISLFMHSRPESRYVIAQLSSGVVVQGRNPHL